jgi:hypothetical protein
VIIDNLKACFRKYKSAWAFSEKRSKQWTYWLMTNLIALVDILFIKLLLLYIIIIIIIIIIKSRRLFIMGPYGQNN